MIDLTENFLELENHIFNEQRLIQTNSCLQAFYGMSSDRLYRISFVSTVRPFEMESTKDIRVTQGQESETVYWTCFDLLNNDVKEVFFIFCNSLVQAIENQVDEYLAMSYLRERYTSWKLLMRNNGKMSYESYQGLYGELYFLLKHLSPLSSVDKAVESWVGPEGFSKDFSINNTWYEIKTIGTSSHSIKINSLAQLDSENEGHLVVIIVEKMSEQYNNECCSVNDLYNEIIGKIEDPQIKDKFINKVLKYGFIGTNPTFANYKFEVRNTSYYLVKEGFPRLTKNNVGTTAISNVTYDLMISAIEQYMENQ